VLDHGVWIACLFYLLVLLLTPLAGGIRDGATPAWHLYNPALARARTLRRGWRVAEFASNAAFGRAENRSCARRRLSHRPLPRSCHLGHPLASFALTQESPFERLPERNAFEVLFGRDPPHQGLFILRFPSGHGSPQIVL